jgi:LuxR family maltose regulon positive regulatory protein
MLPGELVQVRPLLSLALVGILLAMGEVKGVESHLRDTERWLQGERSGMVVVDEVGFRRLPGWVAVYRAGLDLVREDPSATLRYARLCSASSSRTTTLGTGCYSAHRACFLVA